MNDYHARINPKKRSQLLNCFIEDLLVSCRVASVPNAIGRCKVNHKTAERYYRYFREIIYEHQRKLVKLSGQIEIDHTEFGGRRKKRYEIIEGVPVPLKNRKTPVIGILQRGPDSQSHKVFVQIVKRVDKRSTMGSVIHVVESGSLVCTDMHRCFTDLGREYTHKRVNHKRREFSRVEEGIKISTGTIDNFWNYCEKRLARFAGLAQSTIHLHIQECAFRYNHKGDLASAIKKIIQDHENRRRQSDTDTAALRDRRIRRVQQRRSRHRSHTDSVAKVRRIRKPLQK